MKADESTLNKLLKSADTPNVFLLYGKEVFLTKTYTDRILSKYSADKNDGFNFRKFEGCPSPAEISDAVEALPVFAEYRIIIFNDFDIEKYDADSIKIITEIFSDIPKTSIIILTYTGISADCGKSKTKKFFSLIEKNGVVTQFDYLSPQKITGMIVKKAAGKGVRISDENARYIAELTLCDLTLISGEVEKLCSYAESGGEITKQDIDVLVSKQLDTGVFELANAITQNKTQNSFNILKELFDSGYASVMILSALSGVFLDYYAAKLGIVSGKSVNNIAVDFSYPKNRVWVVEKAMRNVKNNDLCYIKKCLLVLYDADYLLKSSPVDDKIILEKTLARLAATK